MKTFHFPSGMVGVALCTLAFLVMAPSGPHTAVNDAWPPAKKYIVNRFEKPNVTITANSSHTVYTVPHNLWLTVTGVHASSSAGPNFVWAEEYGGAVSPKGKLDPSADTIQYSPDGAGGAIGWTFRPGSRVVVHNQHLTAEWILNEYVLIGYLSAN